MTHSIQYDENTKPIRRINFSIPSNDFFQNISATPEGISDPELIENLTAKRGAPNDKRLGPNNYLDTCDTDNLSNNKCMGHFGHIELPKPIFHILTIDNVKDIMQNTCLTCSTILLPDTKDLKKTKKRLMKLKPESRYSEIKKITKLVTSCPKCHSPVKKIKVVISAGIIQMIAQIEIKDTGANDDSKSGKGTKKTFGFGAGSGKGKVFDKISLTPEDCYEKLKNICKEDCELMGIYSRPEEYIVKIFPVSPVAIRPSARADFTTTSTSEDHMTHSYGNIIKHVKKIRELLGKENAVDKTITDNMHVLMYHASIMYDNERAGLFKAEQSRTPFKSLRDRLESKEGRIRNNLNGKRTDFSARTVITPDPFLPIDVVAIPLRIAKNQTFPEKVTEKNKERMQKLVDNGWNNYPGANYVIKMGNLEKDGTVESTDLRFGNKGLKVRVGDIVERHMQNDDVILFNRQPSLHKMSMMAFKARVILNKDISSFRFNPAVCKPFNADFDGDEMNLHFAQTTIAEWELRMIADVKRQIVTAGASKPIIGCVQDTLYGVYLLTDDNTTLTGNEAMNMLMYTSVSRESLKKIDKNKTYTGKELFSMIIPANINAVYRKEDKIKAVIKNSQLVEGRMDKSTVGGERNSLVQYIWDQHDPKTTATFIDDTQRITISWLQHLRGFTFGIGDLIMDPKISKKIGKIVRAKILKIEQIITEMENNPDMADEDMFETEATGELQTITADLGKYLNDNLSDDNNLKVMVTSGANGQLLNIGQIIAAVGQTIVELKRIKKQFTGRTLPHFPIDDDSPAPRGFITSSFLQGLKPAEFFFHMMGGREGIIDTAIKSVTGDTEIFIMRYGNLSLVKIGQWIDELLRDNVKYIQKEKHKDQELLKLDNNKVIIPTTDLNGNVSWQEITHVTRHDPTDKMFKISTKSGRSVTVTDSKSMLIWDEKENKFRTEFTPNVKVGDYVPVTKKLTHPPEKYINPKRLFPVSRSEAFLKEKYLDTKLIDKMEYNCKILTYSRLDIAYGFDKDDKDFRQINDIVLDKIIEIKEVDPTQYKKVYDLTVPSTLNFCLANGLHVVDTADTGYTQRRLVKSLEDLIVCYDATVRNSKGKIIQNLYGDYGINPSMQKNVKLTMINMGDSKMKEKFCFTDDELSQLDGYSSEQNENYYKFILSLRDKLRFYERKIAHKYDMTKEFYASAVDVYRVIENHRKKSKEIDTKLLPQYITSTIESLLHHRHTPLIPMTKEDSDNINSLKNITEQRVKTLFRIILYEYLSPKRCIFEYGLTKKQFETIRDDIINMFNKAVIPAGETVGVLAAQSIGEPSTQLSMCFCTPVCVFNKLEKKINMCKIGDFVDELLKQGEKNKKVKKLGKKSVELKIKNSQFYVQAINNDEETVWKRISHVSRHPANGKMIKVTTRSGRENTATLSHSFLKRTPDGIEPVKGSDLKKGDRIPVAKKLPEVDDPLDTIKITDCIKLKDKWKLKNGYIKNVAGNKVKNKIQLTKNFGWLIGIYLADGSSNKSYIVIIKEDKGIRSKLKEICEGFDFETKKVKKQGTIPAKYSGSTKYDDRVYTSIDTIVKCTNIFATFMKKICGNNAHDKHVPPFAFMSNKEFMAGIVQGYFDGDGNVNVERQMVRTASRSKMLRDDICLLLAHHGICATKLKQFRQKAYYYNINIPQRSIEDYLNNIGTIRKEREKDIKKIIKYANKKKQATPEYIDKIPCLGKHIANIGKLLELPGQSRNYGRWLKKESIGRNTLENYVELFEKEIKKSKKKQKILKIVKADLKVLKHACSIDVVWDEIVKIKILDDPKEMVYDFTVPGDETFMTAEGIFVHNTLNSVDYDTKINIYKDGKMKKKNMGQYIDYLIQNNKDEKLIEKHPNNTTLLWTKHMNLEIPSVDENGKITLEKIEAITKHLPINEDKSNTLLKVATLDGKVVVATKAKSFLTMMDNKVVPIEGSLLKVGMYLPITNPDKNISDDKRDIPGITYGEHKNVTLKRSEVMKLSESSNKEKAKLMKHLLDMDVVFDKIVSIEEVKPTKKYVYDFTVANTKNFIIANGLAIRDTFHLAGVGKAPAGIPRLKEIIGVAKKTKTPKQTIYLKKKYYKNKFVANKLSTHVNNTVLSDIAIKAETIYDPNPFQEDSVMENDDVQNVFYQQTTSKDACQSDISNMPWIIRIILDRERMLDRGLELIDIKSIFCNYWTMSSTMSDSKGDKKEGKQILEKITSCAILSTLDHVEPPVLHVRFDAHDIDFNSMVGFQNWVMGRIKLKGIDKISEAVVVDEKYQTTGEDNEMIAETRYTVETNGINMKDVRYINGIDQRLTYCNDIIQVYELYGIEGARKRILDELRYIDGVNYQHIELLVDYMTADGTLRSIDRHGMAKMDIDPLHKASFEKTVEILLNSGIFQKTDYVKSISSRIMIGHVGRIGTGLPMLIMDKERLENSEVTDEYEQTTSSINMQKVIGNPIMSDKFDKPINIYIPENI